MMKIGNRGVLEVAVMDSEGNIIFHICDSGVVLAPGYSGTAYVRKAYTRDEAKHIDLKKLFVERPSYT